MIARSNRYGLLNTQDNSNKISHNNHSFTIVWGKKCSHVFHNHFMIIFPLLNIDILFLNIVSCACSLSQFNAVLTSVDNSGLPLLSVYNSSYSWRRLCLFTGCLLLYPEIFVVPVAFFPKPQIPTFYSRWV